MFLFVNSVGRRSSLLIVLDVFNCPICKNDYYLLNFVTDSRMNKQKWTSSHIQGICLVAP